MSRRDLLVAVLAAVCCQASWPSGGGGGGDSNDANTRHDYPWLRNDRTSYSSAADAGGLGQRSGDLLVNTTTSSETPYRLVDEYNSVNFWDKFDFIETNTSNQDPTSGFVAYQSRENAERLGLISSNSNGNGIAKMKVDTKEVFPGYNLSGSGRASVRIESLASYAEGLIVADFSHLPGPQCGIWPAFWTYAKEPEWPLGGEIDIYEQWDDYKYNRQTLHMNTSYSGNCTLTPPTTTTSSSSSSENPAFTNYAYTTDCNVVYPQNEGCSTWDFEGPYGSPRGGVYALELTPTTLKMWSFYPSQVPADLAVAVGDTMSTSYDSNSNSNSSAALLRPDPSKWGPPGLMTSSLDGSCDVAATFKNQTIVLNLELCGSAIDGSEWVAACALQTGYNSCPRFVAENPEAFDDYWFGIRSLRVYQRT